MRHFFSMFLLLAIIGLHVSVQSTRRPSDWSLNADYPSLLTVSNGMKWGSWGHKSMCPSGMYAAGFSLKVEEASHAFHDDSSLNGIRLHCVNPSRKSSGSYGRYASIESDVGHWGEWTDIKWCPSGFLKAFQLRVESAQGAGDDTAANNIRFSCSDGFLLQGDGTAWGDWGDWSPKCKGKGICGIKTRILEPQGFFGDDTALNDVQMYCCE
ncbi:vitelline membrane outer layer protein 1-like [Ctenopharyngodon idella]|uniref:vitelline membrane outer layer protein 1-like n=1 Tax=Ctenopharyngodon idella TaxID=7959 RepID=UPI00223185E0|nr:vitelline membrane outer layer protein 1-like [Ctenopharyngodon idella]